MEIHKNPRKAARRMIQDGVPLKMIARMTGLDQDTLQRIAAEYLPASATAPQNPQRAKPPRSAISWKPPAMGDWFCYLPKLRYSSMRCSHMYPMLFMDYGCLGFFQNAVFSLILSKKIIINQYVPPCATLCHLFFFRLVAQKNCLYSYIYIYKYMNNKMCATCATSYIRYRVDF